VRHRTARAAEQTTRHAARRAPVEERAARRSTTQWKFQGVSESRFESYFIDARRSLAILSRTAINCDRAVTRTQDGNARRVSSLIGRMPGVDSLLRIAAQNSEWTYVAP